jgi:hypothetical protein
VVGADAFTLRRIGHECTELQQPAPGEVQRCNWSMASAVRQDGQLTVRSRRLVISETSRVGPRLFDERKELRRLQRRAEVKSLVLIASQLRQQGELLWCIRAIRGSGSTARDC